MQNISVPKDKRLVWYLALEEYAARCLATSDEGVFFTWIVNPTVIIGRHQVMAQEVNLPYCEANNIQVYRRKSGGGCVYADCGNLMMSYIVKSEHPEQVFNQFLDKIAGALQSLGLQAVKTEHNDILVNGQKVSGNACYASDSVIVHGTLMYDVNYEMLQHAITPSVEKMAKHGVQSVRQRVTNLRPLLTDKGIDGIDKLALYIQNEICSKYSELSENDLKAVECIESEYLDTNFIHRL